MPGASGLRSSCSLRSMLLPILAAALASSAPTTLPQEGAPPPVLRVARPGGPPPPLQVTPFQGGVRPPAFAVAPDCSDGEVYDDGEVDNGLGLCGGSDQVTVLSQFTPPVYPWVYDQVCLSFTRFDVDDTLDFELVLYQESEDGSELILLGSQSEQVTGVPAWPSASPLLPFDVTSPPITQGSVWIGASWNGAVDDCFFVAGDEDNEHPDLWSGDGTGIFYLDVASPMALLIRAEGSSVVCGEGEVYDDGVAESGVGTDEAVPVVAVSRFTPPAYPYTYDTVCLAWTRTGASDALAYELQLYDDDGPGGAPGTLLGAVPATSTGVPTFPAIAPFDTRAVPSSPSVTSGAVYIGAAWDAAADPGFFLAADDGSDHPEFVSEDGGLTWTPDPGLPPVTLLVRADGEGPCEDAEAYDDGTGEAGAGGAAHTVLVSRFTPDAYPHVYDEVCAAWVQNAAPGGTADLDYTVVLFDDDGVGGGPGTRLFAQAASAEEIPDLLDPRAPVSYGTTLDCAPAVASGSVWIGVEWDGVAQPGIFLGLDDSGDHPDFTSLDGAPFVPDLDGAFTAMIRAGSTGEGAEATASVVLRNAGTNPLSLQAGPPVLGEEVALTVDLGLTGHALAVVVGFASPLTLPLAGGQTVLVNPADPGGELLALPAATGPLADLSFLVPPDASTCGLALSAQAVHIGGVMPFALSNAVDWVVGR